MKITVNVDLCEANGVCEQFAPNTFSLDDDDELQVSPDFEAAGDADEIAAVTRAAAACPRAALTLIDR